MKRSMQSGTGDYSEDLVVRDHAAEVSEGRRFEFGANWARFLCLVDEDHIRLAEQSLRTMLAVDDLVGKRFLDVGSGSGLFSLAARRLGATVRSFDYDPKSVACTVELKRRFFPDDPEWQIEEGSALDDDYLKTLGVWDVVFSWGVLHHTGAMWQALDHVAGLVAGGGRMFIAVYNDQGRQSLMWKKVKQAYCALPQPLRPLVLAVALIRLWGPTAIRDFSKLTPGASWRNYRERGMSPWHDVVDWVGGLPFEVAKPEDIFSFCQTRGFQLDRLKTCGGGLGCNEFVFTRIKTSHDHSVLGVI
jgi:2-polyprenyl-6-hydroxyphenyl methylase/3-demethylubiquinone-9 3-methyltransferase